MDTTDDGRVIGERLDAMPAGPPAIIEPPVWHALVLPYSMASVSEARRVVRKHLLAQGVPTGLVDDGICVLSELVANAVLHATPTKSGGVRLVWAVGPSRLHLEVTDGGGGGRPRVLNSTPSSTGGRGLAIVSALAREWGVIPRQGSVTVYATVGADPQGA